MGEILTIKVINFFYLGGRLRISNRVIVKKQEERRFDCGNPRNGSRT
jgi:hypothetical protein